MSCGGVHVEYDVCPNALAEADEKVYNLAPLRSGKVLCNYRCRPLQVAFPATDKVT